MRKRCRLLLAGAGPEFATGHIVSTEREPITGSGLWRHIVPSGVQGEEPLVSYKTTKSLDVWGMAMASLPPGSTSLVTYHFIKLQIMTTIHAFTAEHKGILALLSITNNINIAFESKADHPRVCIWIRSYDLDP